MTELLLSHGPAIAYLGFAVLVMLTGAGLPIPEEVFIIAAGVASVQGQLDPWLAMLALLVGALAGDSIMYYIGYHFGRSVVREHRWWAHFVSPEREARMEQSIRRHGLKVLFLARFMVGIRAPVYVTAGIVRVPFRRFLLIDLLCATVVVVTFFGLSYFLWDSYGDLLYTWIHRAEIWLTVVVVFGVAVVSVYYWRRHRRAKTAAALAKNGQDEGHGDPSDKPADGVEQVA
jgi:membrane protein DedA with SNARE-associated domain